MAHGSVRATLELSRVCDNACRFCAQAGSAVDELDVARARRRLQEIRATHDEVTFVGGEPTLVPSLVELVALARDLQFSAVGLQTHGGSLSEAEPRRALLDAGLTDVHLSIHGATAAVHDYHTDRPGSFDRAVAAARGLREAGVPFVVTSVVTRSNARGLDALAALLADLRAAAWMIAWPEVAGRAVAAFDRTIARYGVAMPFVLHAVSIAMRRRLAVALSGFPRCVLGPFDRVALPSRARSFAATCERCDARAECPGVAAEYLDRFGAEELHPREVESAPPALPAAIARMFVGPGPLTFAPHPTAAPSPAAARASLPILGRPAPAVAEVRGKAGRSGDALRELFPDLFSGRTDDGTGDPDDGATSPAR